MSQSNNQPASGVTRRRSSPGSVLGTWALLVVAVGGTAAWIGPPAGHDGPARSAAAAGVADPPTWAADVAPLLYENCVSCHRPDGSGPFSLLEYEDAADRGERILRAVQARHMPPWLPSAQGPRFVGARLLDDGELGMLAEWVAGGAPQGPPEEAPPPPAFAGSWMLGEPDVIAEFPEYRVPAEGRDIYRNVVVRPELDGPVYVRTADLLPGNPRVVHHARFMVDTTASSRTQDAQDPGTGFDGMDAGTSARSPDGFFIGWTPGRVTDPGVSDLAWRLEPGTDLVLQLHLRPTGQEEIVRPRLGLYLADRAPERMPVAIMLENKNLDIPPGEAAYVATERFRLPVDVEALTVYPHAHYLGRSVRSWAELPGGGQRELIRIDEWDFDWQDQYRFRDPISIPAGSEIVMEWTFDNTDQNPRNPFNPPERITFGPESTDEMAELSIQVLPVNPGDRPRLVAELMQFYRGADALRAVEDAQARGDRLASEGRWDEALEAYREALLEANDPMVMVRMAEAFLGLNDHASAVFVAETAVQLQGDSSPRGLLTLARAYEAAGRGDDAQQAARRGLDVLGGAGTSPLADSLAVLSGGGGR